MSDARAMHADLTRLLIELQVLREELSVKSAQEEVIKVDVTGGSF
jgi:hypothetical protein